MSLYLLSFIILASAEMKICSIEMTYPLSTPYTTLPRTSPATVQTIFGTPEGLSYNAEYMINSDFCLAKRSCETSYPLFREKSCYCDEMCSLFGDCCLDYTPEKNRRLLTPSQFSCVSGFTEVGTDYYGIYMVTACSPNWKNNITQQLCESGNGEILSTLPVSNSEDYFVTYKNMYCAQCNFVYNFKYWKISIQCRDDTKTNCKRTYIPAPYTITRACHSSVISTCLPDAQDEVKFKCANGEFSATFDIEGNIYRNEHCATCNGVNFMFCKSQRSVITTPPTSTTPAATGGPAYSYRLLVDFNAASKVDNGITCGDSERFDSFTQVCRKIYCAPPAVAIKGFCTLDTMSSTAAHKNDTEESSKNCTLVKLDPSEYQLRNDSEIFIYSQQKVYSSRDFKIIGTDIFICFQKINSCKECSNARKFIFDYTASESYLSLIGMVISIVSLSHTLIIYLSIPKLLNVPGKNLLCLVVSLLLAQILFLVSARVESIHWVCKTIGILLHYLFMAVFCWMNIIAFDFAMTFSNQYVVSSLNHNSTSKRFKSYSLYAWMVPAVIVAVAVIIDVSNMAEDMNKFKADYGNGICWITSNIALIIFFAGPLALFKLFDIVAFIVTVWFITKAKRQGARASKRKDTCSFLIHLKLSLILGLTWVFAFVANIANDKTVWYLFIIFNSLQGLFIAVCFTFTKRVWKLLKEKWNDRNKMTSSSLHDTKPTSITNTDTRL